MTEIEKETIGTMSKQELIDTLESEDRELSTEELLNTWIDMRLREITRFIKTKDISHLEECISYAWCDLCKLYLRNAKLAWKHGKKELAKQNIAYVRTAYKGLKKHKTRLLKKIEREKD